MVDQPPTIALIDDDPGVTDGLRRGLRGIRASWEFRTFNDPGAFLDVYERTPIDVIVSDMRMPQLSGLELIAKAQELRPVPCIILTGSPDLTSSLYAINEISVFRYYTKPCDLELLVGGISAAISDASLKASMNDCPSTDLGQSLAGQLGLAALDRLALGIAAVDMNGYVRFSNQSAAAIFNTNDSLTLNSMGQCRASTADETAALLKAINDETLGPELVDDRPNVLAVARPSMARPYSVFIAPLSVGCGVFPLPHLAALFISDPEQIPLPVAEQIMKLYGLSRSQALIVQSLASGIRLEEAAGLAGITLSTARTYLKQIFSKTDTSRQSDLVKLVFTAPRLITDQGLRSSPNGDSRKAGS